MSDNAVYCYNRSFFRFSLSVCQVVPNCEYQLLFRKFSISNNFISDSILMIYKFVNNVWCIHLYPFISLCLHSPSQHECQTC